jgi:hypothetical protein
VEELRLAITSLAPLHPLGVFACRHR